MPIKKTPIKKRTPPKTKPTDWNKLGKSIGKGLLGGFAIGGIGYLGYKGYESYQEYQGALKYSEGLKDKGNKKVLEANRREQLRLIQGKRRRIQEAERLEKAQNSLLKSRKQEKKALERDQEKMFEQKNRETLDRLEREKQKQLKEYEKRKIDRAIELEFYEQEEKGKAFWKGRIGRMRDAFDKIEQIEREKK